jgi:predicted unusual protein kinase regulating ubiquinone biosynthesis (AarF/ABC1/UbiB family)
MNDRHRKIPSGRLSRLAAFGQMAGGVASGMMAEGARRLARGERPHMADLLLTPANARRVTQQLSRLRGAAMKLGQMISLDAGDMLPSELTAILAQLRDSAHHMPPVQLQKVLAAQWGQDWRRRFASFEASPIAAASIGQVHRARLPDGRLVAVKVQYPGVAQSIDSDVDNVATLLRMSGLLPGEIDIAPLLSEAKAQLREEADYLREAAQMRRYGALLADDPRFILPRPVDEWTTAQVLVMDFIEARPIEMLEGESQIVRDRAMGALLDLVLQELFSFGYMQTDPNFANYRWQPDSQKIALLDFGAARPVPPRTSEAYRAMLEAGLAGDRVRLRRALVDIGFVSTALPIRHSQSIDGMIDAILTHIAQPGPFDFADRSFVAQLRELAMPIVSDRNSWHLPPAETLFVQRKVSGMALLAVRMKARLPLTQMIAARLAGPSPCPTGGKSRGRQKA